MVNLLVILALAGAFFMVVTAVGALHWFLVNRSRLPRRQLSGRQNINHQHVTKPRLNQRNHETQVTH